MSKQKTLRREKALERLHRQLKEGVKSKNLKENSKTSLSEQDIKRISIEIRLLDFYVGGGKKQKKEKKA